MIFLTALWRYPSAVFLLRSQLTFHFRCFKGNMPFFSLAAIKILLLCLIFSGFIMMYLGGFLFLIYHSSIFRVVWIWDSMFFIVFGNSQSLFLKYYTPPSLIPLSLKNLLSTYARHSQCLFYFCFQLCCVFHLFDTLCFIYYPPAFYILVDYFSLKPVPGTLKWGCS